jgi:hypothetical protein
MLATEVPDATADPFLPELEERLSNLTRAGFDAGQLVRSAAAAGPLPDDHPAAALWWRILDQLPHAPNQDAATPDAVPATRHMTTPSRDQQPPTPRSAAASYPRPEPLKGNTDRRWRTAVARRAPYGEVS